MLPMSVWHRIDCSKCPDRDACDQVPYDCPADNPPMKFPKYISTSDGYIGTFQRLDPGEFPVYRFPGGDRIADEWELSHGSDDRSEIEEFAMKREEAAI